MASKAFLDLQKQVLDLKRRMEALEHAGEEAVELTQTIFDDFRAGKIDFSAFLQGALFISGCTGKDTARSLGVPPSTFNRWVKGNRSPSDFRQSLLLEVLEKRYLATGTIDILVAEGDATKCYSCGKTFPKGALKVVEVSQVGLFDVCEACGVG